MSGRQGSFLAAGATTVTAGYAVRLGRMHPGKKPMIDHFYVELQQQDDAWWFLASLLPGHEAAAATLAAESIVRRLVGHTPDHLTSWLARRAGGPEHAPERKEVLEAFLLSDFEDDGNETRLQGAVVEHLWACLAGELEGGWGRPLHVEHDHFSVIDHGGDGLSIYDFGAPDLRFRLWESKRHDAASSVTTVVTGAAGQIMADGTRYLARMTKALQLHGDARIAILSGRIADLWAVRSPSSGVGVSVGTTTPAGGLPNRPFRGLRRAFNTYPGPEHREGLIILVPDLQALASTVRAELLKGIG